MKTVLQTIVGVGRKAKFFVNFPTLAGNLIIFESFFVDWDSVFFSCHPISMDLLFFIFQYTQVIKKPIKLTRMP